MSVNKIMLKIKLLLHLNDRNTFTGTSFSAAEEFYFALVSSTAPESKHRTELSVA